MEGPEGANLKIIAGEVDLADELAKISSLPLYRENEDKGYLALASGVPYTRSCTPSTSDTTTRCGANSP